MSNRRSLAASIKLRGAFPCFPHGRNCSWNSCSILTVLTSQTGCKLSFTQSSVGIENPNLSPRKNAPLLISPWIRWQGGRSKAVRDTTQQLKLGQDGRKGRTTARRSSRMRPGCRVGVIRRARKGWGRFFSTFRDTVLPFLEMFARWLLATPRPGSDRSAFVCAATDCAYNFWLQRNSNDCNHSSQDSVRATSRTSLPRRCRGNLQNPARRTQQAVHFSANHSLFNWR